MNLTSLSVFPIPSLFFLQTAQNSHLSFRQLKTHYFSFKRLKTPYFSFKQLKNSLFLRPWLSRTGKLSEYSPVGYPRLRFSFRCDLAPVINLINNNTNYLTV